MPVASPGLPERRGRRTWCRIKTGLKWTGALLFGLFLTQVLFGAAGAGTGVSEFSLTIHVVDAATGRPLSQADVLVIEGGAQEARAFSPVPPVPSGSLEEMDQVVKGLAARGTSDAAGLCRLRYMHSWCHVVSGWDLITQREADPAPPVRGTCLVAAAGYVTAFVDLSRFVADTEDGPSDPDLPTASRLRTTVALHRR